MTAPDDKLAKIRALLAKAESTTFEAEAATYIAKAQELMLRYSVDEAMLAKADGQARPEPILVTFEGRSQKWWQLLANAAADGAGCKVVMTGVRIGPGNIRWTAKIAGLPADIEWAQMLLTSLLLQLESGVRRDGAGLGRTWANSYRLGYASRLRSRLAEARLAARRRAEGDTDGAALVFAGNDRDIDGLLGRSKVSKVRMSADHGYHAGSSAANHANLSRGTGLGRSRQLTA